MSNFLKIRASEVAKKVCEASALVENNRTLLKTSALIDNSLSSNYIIRLKRFDSGFAKSVWMFLSAAIKEVGPNNVTKTGTALIPDIVKTRNVSQHSFTRKTLIEFSTSCKCQKIKGTTTRVD